MMARLRDLLRRTPTPAPTTNHPTRNMTAAADSTACAPTPPAIARPDRMFAPITLSAPEPLPADVVQRHAAALADKRVWSAAARLADRYAHLCDVALQQYLIDRATVSSDGTPSGVIAWVEAQIRALERELESTRAEHKRQAERLKQLRARTAALRSAVSSRLDSAVRERDQLANRPRPSDGAVAQSIAETRDRLRAIGLPDAEIARLESQGLTNPVDRRAQDAQARVRELGPLIDTLRAFSRDPHRLELLDPFEEFAPLVAEVRAGQDLPV